MTDPQPYTFQASTGTWWGKLLALAVGILIAGIAIVFFTVFLGLIVVAIIAAPIIGWWRRKKAAREPRPAGPDGKPVIDVDYEVHD